MSQHPGRPGLSLVHSVPRAPTADELPINPDKIVVRNVAGTTLTNLNFQFVLVRLITILVRTTGRKLTRPKLVELCRLYAIAELFGASSAEWQGVVFRAENCPARLTVSVGEVDLQTALALRALVASLAGDQAARPGTGPVRVAWHPRLHTFVVTRRIRFRHAS